VSLPLQRRKWNYIPSSGADVTVLFGEARTYAAEVNTHLAAHNGAHYTHYPCPFTEDTQVDRSLYHELTECVSRSLYELEQDSRIQTTDLTE
jgi:hypothetical protein